VNDLGGAADGSGAGTSMADQVVKEIAEAGGTAVSNYDSVATPEGGEAIIATALDNFGQVDVVVNNAGILRDKSFAKLSPEALEIVLDVHLKGAFFVSQPAFRAMKGRSYGRFVHTASAAGIFGNFGQSNYGAAKMGLVGLSNVLAVEGAKNNIKSNVIAPVARTRLTEDLLGPMAEHVTPECVTPLTVYLSSESCEETHSIYSVGGGRYARIFIAMGQGWVKGPGQAASVEEIAANWEAIHSDANYTIPDSISGEMTALAEALKG
jgi:NAD(P)-dependent dehydrogenase (short-subunit alcohol dehydrogenase family)